MERVNCAIIIAFVAGTALKLYHMIESEFIRYRIRCILVVFSGQFI